MGEFQKSETRTKRIFTKNANSKSQSDPSPRSGSFFALHGFPPFGNLSRKRGDLSNLLTSLGFLSLRERPNVTEESNK